MQLHFAVFLLTANEQNGGAIRKAPSKTTASKAVGHLWWLVRNTAVLLELSVSGEQYTALFGSSVGIAEEGNQHVTSLMWQV